MNRFLKLLVISALCMAAVPAQGSHTAVVHRWSVRTVIDSVVKAVWTNRTRKQKIVGVLTALALAAGWYRHSSRPQLADEQDFDELVRAVQPSFDAQQLQKEIDAVPKLVDDCITLIVKVDSFVGYGYTIEVKCNPSDDNWTVIRRVCNVLLKAGIDIDTIANRNPRTRFIPGMNIRGMTVASVVLDRLNVVTVC